MKPWKQFVLGVAIVFALASLGTSGFTAKPTLGQQQNFSPLPGTGSTAGTTPIVINAIGTTGALTLNPAASGNGVATFTILDGAGNVAFRVLNNGASTYQVQLGGTFGAHLTQGAANGDIAGTVTCATSTVTKTFANAYFNTPIVILTDETTAGGARPSAKSTTAFTVTCTGATDVVDYWVIGNPN